MPSGWYVSKDAIGKSATRDCAFYEVYSTSPPAERVFYYTQQVLGVVNF